MSVLKTKLQAILAEKNKLLANNLMVGNTIFGITGTATSDSNAAPINIKTGNTAYVNGSKITGILPVLNYPVNPSNPSDWDYQFIEASSAKSVTRQNTSYVMGSYQIASESDPDSWMFEGNRKMKMGIPFANIISLGGIKASKIVTGNTIFGVSGSAIALKGQTKTITPTTGKQTVTPDSNYNGFTQVVVNAVTSSIDANIIPENIAEGVTILGVTGTYSGGGQTVSNIEIFPSKSVMDDDINDFPYDEIGVILEEDLDLNRRFNGIYVKKEVEEIDPDSINFYNNFDLQLDIHNYVIDSYYIVSDPPIPTGFIDVTSLFDIFESILLNRNWRMPEFGIIYDGNPSRVYLMHVNETNLNYQDLTNFINNGGKIDYNYMKYEVNQQYFKYAIPIPNGYSTLFQNISVDVYTIDISNPNNPSIVEYRNYGYTYESQYNRAVSNNYFQNIDPSVFPVSVSLDLINETFEYNLSPKLYQPFSSDYIDIVEYDSRVYTGNMVDKWVEIKNKGDIVWEAQS